jgi:hypothetical protein
MTDPLFMWSSIVGGVFLMTVKIILLSLAIASISLTTAQSKVFTSTRQWIIKRNKWFGELVSCSYCTSHWLAIAGVFGCNIYCALTYRWLESIIYIFVVVSVSNMFMGLLKASFLVGISKPGGNNARSRNKAQSRSNAASNKGQN